jgi:hypothetical protein
MKTKKSVIWFFVFYTIIYAIGAGIAYLRRGNFIVYDEYGDEQSVLTLAAAPLLLIIFMFFVAFIPTIKIAVSLSTTIPIAIYAWSGLRGFRVGIFISLMLAIIIVGFSYSIGGYRRYDNPTAIQKIIDGYKELHTSSRESVRLFFSNIRELCGIEDISIPGVLLKKITEIAEEISFITICDMTPVVNTLQKIIDNNKDQIITMVTEKNRTIESLALMFLKQDLDARLSSGEYHLYRGILGIQGEGLMKAYRIVNDRLYKHGYITQEIRDTDLKSLSDDIKNGG